MLRFVEIILRQAIFKNFKMYEYHLIFAKLNKKKPKYNIILYNTIYINRK